MSIVPRDPFEVFMPLREAMNRLFEESVISPRLELFTGRTFPLDVYETQDGQQYIVEAALPGCKPEDFQITAGTDTLTIQVRQKEERKSEKGAYIRRERYEGEMSRTITFPTGIDSGKIEATYEHGMLMLKVPKVEQAKPVKIAVKVK